LNGHALTHGRRLTENSVSSPALFFKERENHAITADREFAPIWVYTHSLLGDKAYDADQFIAKVQSQGIKIVIPPKR
jgi:hypothetical protein